MSSIKILKDITPQIGISLLLPLDKYNLCHRLDFKLSFQQYCKPKGINVKFLDNSVSELPQPHGPVIIIDSHLKDSGRRLNDFRLSEMIVPVILSHEPRFDVVLEKDCEGRRFINMYTDDMYQSCLHYMSQAHLDLIKDLPKLIESKAKNYQPSVIQMASYNKWMIDQNFEHDITAYRAEIALAGVAKSHSGNFQFDLFGRGWGNVPVKENTRSSANWQELKYSTIKPYFINIALENTYWPFYVSEKIWDSLCCGLIPVYKGSTWLDNFFHPYPPPIIDTRDFLTLNSLFQYIESLTSDDYQRIMLQALPALEKISLTDINNSKHSRFKAISTAMIDSISHLLK